MVLLLACVAASPSSKPTSIPTSRPVAKKFGASDTAARSAIRNAVAALNKEFDAYLRNPTTASLRTSCNYFGDHPSADVNAEAVVPALTTPVAGDTRAAAYVRWQLLSGLPAKIDDATARQLLVAYRASPGPMARFGISAEDQQKLDRLAQGVKQENEPDLRAKIDEAISVGRRENAPILAYRDELYRRLPKTPETFAIALDDLSQRNAAVADGGPPTRGATSCCSWCSSPTAKCSSTSPAYARA